MEDLADLRESYLDSCSEAQELYLEMKIWNAEAHVLVTGAREAGYVLVGRNGVLLEFFVQDAFVRHADAWFGEILRRLGIRKALCKSFDATLLTCAMHHLGSVRVEGILCREWVDVPRRELAAGISTRWAEPRDAPTIIAVNEEVFDHPDEIHEYIRDRKLLLFETGTGLLGFGLHSRVIAGRPEFDIGMLVVPEHRGKGHGSAIIHHMADHCRNRGWRPICGCDVANVGSRKCLENAGFVPRHRLLEFNFPED
jgi:GNAT superfamily N-acetyltransferase